MTKFTSGCTTLRISSKGLVVNYKNKSAVLRIGGGPGTRFSYSVSLTWAAAYTMGMKTWFKGATAATLVVMPHIVQPYQEAVDWEGLVDRLDSYFIALEDAATNDS